MLYVHLNRGIDSKGCLNRTESGAHYQIQKAVF